MIFPEGHGRPRALPKGHSKAPLINALLMNVKEAIDELWKQRGYSALKKDEIKARLGCRLRADGRDRQADAIADGGARYRQARRQLPRREGRAREGPALAQEARLEQRGAADGSGHA